MFDGSVEEGQQRRVEISDIEHADRFVVQVEVAPGPDLEQLLQRTDTAGQGDEGIGMRGHGRLAFVHVVDPDQPGQAMVRDFALHEMFWHHADHFTAFG